MTATLTIHVRCTFIIPVEVPDSPDYDATFDIEENHCPGTGRVGAAIEERMKQCDDVGICWACTLGGENKIMKAGEMTANLESPKYEYCIEHIVAGEYGFSDVARAIMEKSLEGWHLVAVCNGIHYFEREVSSNPAQTAMDIHQRPLDSTPNFIFSTPWKRTTNSPLHRSFVNWPSGRMRDYLTHSHLCPSGKSSHGLRVAG